ncbi:MAG: arylsulfatase, partial [Planctomycetaceae bacterium]|nr:arylsulfatase [Planctomycetaceae bacterium]
GPWKLLVKVPRRKGKKTTSPTPEVLLFNLEEDLGEKENLATEYPEVVSDLQEKMKALDAEITLNGRSPWLEGV